jgi:hypothetical protein
MRFLAGLGVGIFAGYLLGLVIPLKVFMIACLVILAVVILLFFLFHLGVRDFQEY